MKIETELSPKKLEKQRLKELKQESQAAELKFKELKAKELEAKLRKSQQKETAEAGNTDGLFGSTAEPRKALSTYLRNQNKAEISFVSILDRKSAILIRICTTLISGIIVFNSYIEENVEMGHLISHILLAGLMITLISAILGTKPAGPLLKRIFKNRIQAVHSDPEENLFFLTQPYTLQEYESAMSKIVKSQDLQIGNQVRANYFLASNNVIKTRVIDFSYTVFLCTFVVIGLVVLVSKIIH